MSRHWLFLVLFFGLVVSATARVSAQEQASGRRLAAGVLTVITPEPREEETFTGPVELGSITRGIPKPPDPNFTAPSATLHEMAKHVILRREIWNLEFAFKPLRMIELPLPQRDGTLQPTLIWYMVYRVKNRGGHLSPTPNDDETYTTVEVDGPIQRFPRVFVPQFILESHEFNKQYLDRIIPLAEEPIRRREKMPFRLLNTVEMSQVPIQVNQERWGLVTWEWLDPNIDFFSIYVQGLTNAFRIQAGPQGRVYRYKSLQLNFWRPGDTVAQHENEIRFGVPIVSDEAEQAQIYSQYGIDKYLEHLWVYR